VKYNVTVPPPLPSDDTHTPLNSNRSLTVARVPISERLLEERLIYNLTQTGGEALYLEQLMRRESRFLSVSEMQEIKDDEIRRKILDAMSKAKTIKAEKGQLYEIGEGIFVGMDKKGRFRIYIA